METKIPPWCIKGKCPICGYPAIVHIKGFCKGFYDCWSHHSINKCNFYGTIEEAKKLRREKRQGKRRIKREKQMKERENAKN